MNLRANPQTSRRSSSVQAVLTGRFASGQRYELGRRLQYQRLSDLSHLSNRPISSSAGRPESPIHPLPLTTPVRRSVMNRIARIAIALLSFNALFVAAFATELVSAAKVLS